MNIERSEALALISALGAAAALLSTDGGESQRPIYDLGERFGLSPDLPEDSVDTSNPDGSPTDPDWLGDVGDSAPTPDSGDTDDVDLPDDSVGVSNPDGSDTSDDWLGDVGDSAPTPDDETDATPGDTTTGGTTPVGETGVSWDDVAGVGDHLAGSTDEWVGGLW